MEAGALLELEPAMRSARGAPARQPALASSGEEGFLLIWSGGGAPAAGDTEIAAAYRQLGARSPASVFQVNTHAGGYQRGPTACGTADGNFIVAWSSLYQDGDGEGVFAQAFLTARTRLPGSELPVLAGPPASGIEARPAPPLREGLSFFSADGDTILELVKLGDGRLAASVRPR